MVVIVGDGSDEGGRNAVGDDSTGVGRCEDCPKWRVLRKVTVRDWVEIRLAACETAESALVIWEFCRPGVVGGVSDGAVCDHR